MIAAFFDVDGTLYSGRVWGGLMDYWKTHGRRLDARLYYLRFMPHYIARKLKLISEERFRAPWAEHLAWPMRGWTKAQAQACFDWVAREYLKPLRRENVIARLHEHQSQGHVVVLVSSGLAPLLGSHRQDFGRGARRRPASRVARWSPDGPHVASAGHRRTQGQRHPPTLERLGAGRRPCGQLCLCR